MPYLTPSDLPEGDDCRPLSIPASSEWLALFGGALTELTKTWNWEYSGGLTIEETVAKMSDIIDNWYEVPCAACVTPGGYRVTRINNQGHLQQLDENGEWVDPTDEYYIPPPEPRTGGTETDQICLAAKNAVNVLKELYENLSDSYNAELEQDEAITAFILGAIALVGFEFAPITWSIVAFMTPVFAALYAALGYIFADLWDAEVSDQITCFLLNCATNDGGVVTFDYDCLMGAMLNTNIGGEWTESRARLMVQLSYVIPIMGGVDALNAAGATTELTSADCDDCEGGWCRLYDFTLDDYGFAPQLFGAVPLANWVDGVGFESVYVNTGGGSPTGYRINAIAAPFSATVQYLEMGFVLTPGTLDDTGDTNALAADGFAETFFARNLTLPVTSPITWCYDELDPPDAVDVTFQLLAQLFAGAAIGGADPGGSVTITYIKVMGVGAPPIDGEVCEYTDCFGA